MSFSSRIAKNLTNYNSEKSIAFKFRAKRAEKIKELIFERHKQSGEVRIIDVGGTDTYWKIIPRKFLTDNNVRITIVNLPSSHPLPPEDEIFTFRHGDGCNLAEYGDRQFHIGHSNSVIEHVGAWEDMVKFANEMKRVSEKVYLQTPNFRFPIEPHFMTPFFHWLPWVLRVWIIRHAALGHMGRAANRREAIEKIDSCRLLSGKELCKLFPDGKIFREKFIGLTKSFIVTS